MNVEELIALLQTFKPDWPVVLGNFGGGFDDLEEVNSVILALNVIVSSESGSHISLEALTEKEQGNFQVSNAVCIGNLDPSLVTGRRMRVVAPAIKHKKMMQSQLEQGQLEQRNSHQHPPRRSE